MELMTGCYTDNQPDFTWMMPYEEKTFTQYFMHNKEVWSRKTAYLLDILSFLEFVDNKLTTIFVLNSTE